MSWNFTDEEKKQYDELLSYYDYDEQAREAYYMALDIERLGRASAVAVYMKDRTIYRGRLTFINETGFFVDRFEGGSIGISLQDVDWIAVD